MTQQADEVPVVDGVADFTIERGPIRFRISPDVFEAVPGLATNEALAMVAEAERIRDSTLPIEERMKIIGQLMDRMLQPESAQLFRERLGSREHPIELPHIYRLIPWLLGQLGLRPTGPSAPSLTGSGSLAAGMKSTGGSQSVELTPDASPSPGS